MGPEVQVALKAKVNEALLTLADVDTHQEEESEERLQDVQILLQQMETLLG